MALVDNRAEGTLIHGNPEWHSRILAAINCETLMERP